jgi:hypothetical protein
VSDFEERYSSALEERGLEDVRPLYRKLLVRLRKRDEGAYEEGVRRYREELEPALEEEADPLGPWLRYGAWLARRLADGEVTAVAPDGSASTVGLDGGRDADAGGDGLSDLPSGVLLLYLPADDGEPGFPLAVPADPSVHQEATRELLCG